MIESKQQGLGVVTLVDRGRGLQLSTSRITVMDLVQYLRLDWSYEKIVEIITSLTREEFDLIEDYYRAHKEELDIEDDRVVAYREEQLRIQRERFPMPDETTEERMARFRKLIQQRQQGANGEGTPR
jgi:uncharacterized protein YeeX (DUF496 family)